MISFCICLLLWLFVASASRRDADGTVGDGGTGLEREAHLRIEAGLQALVDVAEVILLAQRLEEVRHDLPHARIEAVVLHVAVAVLDVEEIDLPELAVVSIRRKAVEHLVLRAEDPVGADAVRLVAAEVLAVGAAKAACRFRLWIAELMDALSAHRLTSFNGC